MKKHYQVITNPDALVDFIADLPELSSDERYYVSLLARNKYCKDIKHIATDKIQLFKTAVPKEYLYETFMKMEVPIGAYRVKGVEVPQEALATYIHINPRSLTKAMGKVGLAVTEALISNSKLNIELEVMSQISKARSRKIYSLFDLDSKDMTTEMLRHKLNQIVGYKAYRILETRGGYHILIEPKYVEDQLKSTWHSQLIKFPGIDRNINSHGIQTENMIPVPGTYQGGFTPILLK